MADRISSEAEAKLVEAASDVQARVAAGDSPNDAICKVAAERQLPAGHIPLLARAHNVASTIDRLHSGGSALEKAADFPIADPDVIVSRLFPATPAREPDLSFYAAPPARKAAALAELSVADAAGTQFAPIDTRIPFEAELLKVAAEVDATARMLDEPSRLVDASTFALADRVDALASYFKSASCLAWSDVRANAEHKWGAPAVAVLDWVAGSNAYVKAAGMRDPFHAVDPAAEPYRSVLAIVKAAEEHAALVAARDDLAAKLDQVADAAVDALSKMPAFAKEANYITAGMGYDVGGRIVDSVLPPGDRQRAKAERALEDPEHEQQLREIRTQAGIHDLFSDPVIGGHGPAEVAGAYNPMSEAAPVASTQPMFARAMVRKILAQGGLEPFDVDGISRSEQTNRDLHHSNDFRPARGLSGEMKRANLGSLLD